jgi:hypothetical protein
MIPYSHLKWLDSKGFDLELDVAFELAAMTDDPLYRRELLRLAADATGAGHLPRQTPWPASTTLPVATG